MFGKRFTGRAILAGAATLAVLVGGSSAALATAPSSTNVYQGCLTHNGGVVYNVQISPTTPPRCATHDTQISWNQAGAPGLTGATGPQGATGAQGPAGPTHQIVGAINADGTPQGGPTLYSVSLSGTTYKIVYRATDFTSTPVPVIMTLGGAFAVGSFSYQNGDGTWESDITLNTPATFNFIAAQLTS